MHESSSENCIYRMLDCNCVAHVLLKCVANVLLTYGVLARAEHEANTVLSNYIKILSLECALFLECVLLLGTASVVEARSSRI